MVGAVGAFPLPWGDNSLFYYEIAVRAMGSEGILGIGFALKDYRHSMPGPPYCVILLLLCSPLCFDCFVSSRMGP